MSSLWTPGGEVPVDRYRGTRAHRHRSPPVLRRTPSAPPTRAQAQAIELQRLLLEAPAFDIVAKHAMGLYELAAIHLSQPEPRLATPASPSTRWQPWSRASRSPRRAEGAMPQALPQLRMAFVQRADRSGRTASDD